MTDLFFVILMQDDSYLDSYISTIGVDFVRICVFWMVTVILLNHSSDRVFGSTENSNRGARGEDN